MPQHKVVSLWGFRMDTHTVECLCCNEIIGGFDATPEDPMVLGSPQWNRLAEVLLTHQDSCAPGAQRRAEIEVEAV